ncbi:AraC family transcriptional regulator [Anabaena cylindrica FACHB-243]|uniref:Transcriptional regulator, AraC family n=1 Tax=Anabaena cylindrica (strain ATCC 27899 / PCC 7122) TaxID=272123 RepID=K9ZK90_ANACC|nr:MULTISPECIES: AraC family transcriptional regulator [Anabaena]AFZ59631.1 transcriptional regulator, AraC family [Anabaena cylindrica PCC 7122]MBD2418707.1 AraC family transcriptional regulator [Anabaena cylindrica FACHB-243]MBY5281666.1 AraC family transcriptional regulator [Anabaena sp. CCAP 1446/1C]MBY5309192.1 AraC family transcriptional regulator [Anabaena sp. CCAP 1446/1C]MCM2406269.1 AraC family transcriptional regulator [Anabaena sp. CCAP 1446/1C]
MQDARFSVAIVRDIVQYVAAQGVDINCLYTAANIDPAWLDNPDRQVSGEVLKYLWREAVQQTSDRYLGLHIGESFDLSVIGIVGYVLLNCQTYGQVLEKLSQYTRLFSQGVTIYHTVSKGWAHCNCEIVGNLNNYLIDEPRHPIESTFAALVTATQQLTGKPLQAAAVWFQHQSPEDCSEHERIFRTTVQFSQPMNRIVFDSNCLNWSVRSANANLLSVFEHHAITMLNAQKQSQGYPQKVISSITQQLHGEVPTIEAIAHSLTISVRQLQRELQAENTSYQQLLDKTRRELAMRHLQNRETSIHDVAFLLGFSEPSAFHRAFKRWTKQTPRSYRLAQSILGDE